MACCSILQQQYNCVQEQWIVPRFLVYWTVSAPSCYCSKVTTDWPFAVMKCFPDSSAGQRLDQGAAGVCSPGVEGLGCASRLKPVTVCRGDERAPQKGTEAQPVLPNPHIGGLGELRPHVPVTPQASPLVLSTPGRGRREVIAVRYKRDRRSTTGKGGSG